jgi:carboxypeptidase C (cathepsin A)
MSDFVVNQVGWKADGHYEALSDQVNRDWDHDTVNNDAPVNDLRRAIAIDPKMAVNIVHGWDDLSCPFFASRLIVDQMPAFGGPDRVQLHMYPGGHMFYARPDSGAALRRDIMASYAG